MRHPSVNFEMQSVTNAKREDILLGNIKAG